MFGKAHEFTAADLRPGERIIAATKEACLAGRSTGTYILLSEQRLLLVGIQRDGKILIGPNLGVIEVPVSMISRAWATDETPSRFEKFGMPHPWWSFTSLYVQYGGSTVKFYVSDPTSWAVAIQTAAHPP